MATLFDLLSHHLNICERVSLVTLRRILPALISQEDVDAASELVEDEDRLARWCEKCQPRLADLFRLFPSLALTAEEFAAMLSDLRPRW